MQTRLKNSFWTVLIITLSKIVSLLSRLLRRGYGGTWPGEVALTLQKDFIARVLASNPRLKIVLVTGTNGKTTTSKLIAHVLRKEGLRVFSNGTGANLLNGIASILIRNCELSGRIEKDIAVFEVDENILPHLLKQFSPDAVLLLNLFRDQLDRYGEVDSIRRKWLEALKDISPFTKLIINGQDPNLFYLGKELNRDSTSYFGLDKNQLKIRQIPPEADTIYCPICFQHLTFEAIGYSHIGIFSCPKHGGNSHSFIDLSADIASPISGLFNNYNICAAALCCRDIFGVSTKKFNDSIIDFTAAFGRQEIIKYRNRHFHIQLSKNPTGFNQGISLIEEAKDNKKEVLVILNNRIPDGRDVSWIWDVNYEQLVNCADRIWVTGDRAYDMATRLKYAVRETVPEAEQEKVINSKLKVFETLDETLSSITKQTNDDSSVFVLPVYSAMLDLRQKLVGGEIK